VENRNPQFPELQTEKEAQVDYITAFSARQKLGERKRKGFDDLQSGSVSKLRIVDVKSINALSSLTLAVSIKEAKNSFSLYLHEVW